LSFSDVVQVNQTLILDYAERYITTSCYHLLFCSPVTNEEEMDLHIQKHIRNLKWISPNDLSSPIDLHHDNVPSLLTKAIKGRVENTQG
jgi:hypothetical protein